MNLISNIHMHLNFVQEINFDFLFSDNILMIVNIF